MAYTPEQRKIAKKIVRIGRKTATGYKKARRVKIKSALETGLVESNLRNLNYGDADSRGWRQERASLYADPNNLKASIKRYFAEANQHYDPGETAGEVAGQVQRPAAEYLGRYAERGPEAKALLESLLNGNLGAAAGGKGGGSKTTTRTDASASVDLTGLRKAALLRYLDDRGKPDALLGLASDLQSVKDAAGSLKVDGGTTTTTKTNSKSKVSQKYSDTPGKLPSPDPDRPWEGTRLAIKHFQQQAKELGLTPTSNKRNNTNPYSGSGSDHDYGNKDAFASDVSNGSSPTPEMDEYAYRVAKQLGIPYKKGTPIMKTVVRNGIRYQLIYRGTGAAFGGNHLNHVHLGAKRV